MDLKKLLPNNCQYDKRFDYDKHSINNIIYLFPHMDLLMAKAISEASCRQVFRDKIKRELSLYFFNLYIDDNNKLK